MIVAQVHAEVMKICGGVKINMNSRGIEMTSGAIAEAGGAPPPVVERLSMSALKMKFKSMLKGELSNVRQP